MKAHLSCTRNFTSDPGYGACAAAIAMTGNRQTLLWRGCSGVVTVFSASGRVGHAVDELTGYQVLRL